MEKIKKEVKTVYLSDCIYFTVTKDEFTLYHKKEGAKAPIKSGYFTDMTSLIKKAIRITSSDNGNTTFMASFLEEWREIQESLLINLQK